MPFRHHVLVPGSEFLGIRRAGRAGIAPDRRVADGECRISNAGTCVFQGSCMDKAPVHVQQLVIADILASRCNALKPGIRAMP